MKRSILACLILLALLPAAADATPGSTDSRGASPPWITAHDAEASTDDRRIQAKSRGMFMNGDSLAVGTQPYFPSALPRWSIRTSASISRHAFEGPGVLRAAGRLPRVIAVSLGTNDDPRNTSAFRAAIRETMAVVGPRRCVVWATVKRPPVAGATYGEYNRILREEAERRPNLEVVRWARMAAQNPQWFGGDGVHPDATGYRARAEAYAEKIRRCP